MQSLFLVFSVAFLSDKFDYHGLLDLLLLPMKGRNFTANSHAM